MLIYKGREYLPTSSNLIKVIRKNSSELDSLIGLDEYFSVKIGVEGLDKDQMLDIFTGIIEKNYDVGFVKNTFNIFSKYEFSNKTITKQYLSEVFIKTRGQKNNNDIIFFQNYFGNQWEIAKSRYKQPNLYSIDYWLDKGFSEIEANQKIVELKQKTSGNLNTFISRYGLEEGTKRYKEFSDKISHSNTLQGHIDRYGFDEGTKRYYEQNNRKSISATKEGHLKRHGNLDLYNSANENRSYKCSTEGLIETFGYEKAMSICESKRITLEYLIDTYGEEQAKIINDNKTIWFKKELAIEKFGEDSYLEFHKKWVESCRRSKQGHTPRISKESYIPLKIIYDWCVDKNISNDIKWGFDETGEKVIYLTESSFKKRRLYDFCIESLNVIIEYQGSAWHADWRDYCSKSWKSPYGITKDESIKRDMEKRELAEKHGYNVYYIWDNTWKEDVLLIISNLENIYENKKY